MTESNNLVQSDVVDVDDLANQANFIVNVMTDDENASREILRVAVNAGMRVIVWCIAALDGMSFPLLLYGYHDLRVFDGGVDVIKHALVRERGFLPSLTEDNANVDFELRMGEPSEPDHTPL